MSFKEQYRKVPFDENDCIEVRKIVKGRRDGIIVMSVVMFILFWVSPYISRTGKPLIFQMSYWEALLWMWPFMPILPLLYWFLSRSVFEDSRNGSKVILQTKVMARKRTLKSVKNIKVSNPEIDDWLSFARDETLDIREGDCVNIKMLPESKVILKCEKIIV